MLNAITINGYKYEFDLASPIDISIPLNFNGSQPNAFGVDPATSTPCAAGELVGDTRQGGSCNFERYTFIPHCNGTHTECVGHITHERISVRDCLKDVLNLAWLFSIKPQSFAESNETYPSPPGSDDVVITREALRKAVGDFQSTRTEAQMDAIATGAFMALIIRTLPNDAGKLSREYTTTIPPYFTNEAMEFIVECGFNHLLVDLPSIDRLYDEGALSNHRIFWDVEQGKFETHEYTRDDATITELIYVPDTIEDGEYLLNLQIAPFASDASPSRPILFRVEQN